MMFWMVIMTMNLVISVFVGLTGVAGFLPPIMYTNPLRMGVTRRLTLSFTAFIVSGTLGSVNCDRAGNLDVPFDIRFSLRSLADTVLGTKLNLTIPRSTVKVILCVAVLLPGISILLRRNKNQEGSSRTYVVLDHLTATLVLGFATEVVCSLSGAGGPVLVMSLLVALGTGIRTAVGVALFSSVFIGIPARVGYMIQYSVKGLLPIMATALAFHDIRAIYRSRGTAKISQILLKKGIAVSSILIAIWGLAL